MKSMYRLYLFNQYEQLSEKFMNRALLVLPNDRRTRAQHYRQEIDRKNSIVTYLMLQYALRECFGIAAFRVNFPEYGRPYLPEYPHIHFSISHCKEGCAVAVAHKPIGVDIQEIRPFSWSVAERVCCESELAQLEKCADQEKCFTKMWTIKESYIKMIGQGLSYGMDRIDTNKVCTNVATLKFRNCFVSVFMCSKESPSKHYELTSFKVRK